MEPSARTVIIGAGVGGLAAGYFLQEAGRQVEIYGRASVPGGRIQLLEKDGARRRRACAGGGRVLWSAR